MTNSIPASELVQVIPSVLGAGGAPLSMNGVIITEDASIPIGTVMSFPNATEVADWFGPSSNQAALADVYFDGYEGATQLPSALFFAQFNANAVAGYLRGGTVAGLTLAQLQALSGTITVVIDGVSHTSSAINLAGAASFSAAASLIQSGLQGGSPSTTATVTYDALRAAFVITSSTTGASSAVGFGTDSSLSPGLFLTAATGAVQSPGAATSTPAATMAMVAAATQNWAAFTTDWLPTSTIMLEFAAWVATQDDRFVYVGYDNNAAALAPNASSSFGVETSEDDGVCAVWNPSGLIAAFILGTIASINFNQANGRINFAYRSGSGLAADVTSASQAAALIGNHYNFYGAYATAAQGFQFLQNGQVSGSWAWLDSYVNQIYFNAAFQLALMELLSQINSIPYNAAGMAAIQSALQPVINQMVSFGAAVAGTTLSGSQAAAVNAAAGVNITAILQNQGWYLQVLPPSAAVRAVRGSPIVKYFYCDGESVNTITMDSTDIL